MKTGHSVGGKLVGGFVFLSTVVASLVLVNMASLSASPKDLKVQPVPVPTPPPVQTAAPSGATDVPALLSSQPAPVPVPTPPDGPVAPRDEAGRSAALLLLGLSVLAACGLFLLRWAAGLPAENKPSTWRQASTACQEC